MMDLLDILPRTIECVGVSVIYPETSSAPAIAELRKRATVTGFGVRPARDLVRRADVVISWGMMPLAECLQDFRGRRITVIHGSDVDYSRHVVTQALAVGAELVAVSEACLLPCGDHPARVLRSGVSPDRLHCTEAAGAALRDTLGIRDEEMVVGFVGRLSAEKRISKLLAAVPHLPPNYRVLIVGDGFDTARLQAEAAPLGDRVLFLTGRMDIAPIYAALDLFWCGSPSEGLPYTLMEAALAGIPLVTTRVGVLHEIAARHGLLWTELMPNPTPEHIALALVGATMSCNDLRDVMLEEYGLEAMGRRWTDYLMRS
jgi:glycosyltransferase involved in cell wall biosynthesis